MAPIQRFLAALACAWALSGCAADEPPPPPPPSTFPGGGGTGSPQPQPIPPRVDAGGGGLVDAGAEDAGQQGCGGPGQFCCPDDPACAGDFTHCDEQFGQCVACGSGGQQCCNRGQPCRGALFCSEGICTP